MMKLLNVFICLVLFNMSFSLMAKGVEDISPLDVIKSTADAVLAELAENKAILKDHPEKIYDIVETRLIPHFDFESMSRLVLGKHWRKASDEDKLAFTEQFKKLLIRTYAVALMSYSGQEIHYLPLRKSKKLNRATVMTEVREVGGPAIPIHYKVKKKVSWKVYDVVIDGISLVSNYRSGFNSQIKRIKLSGLIEKLRSRNAKKKSHDT